MQTINISQLWVNISSSWWFQPLWKICWSKWVHLLQFSGWKFQKYLSCHHPVIHGSCGIVWYTTQTYPHTHCWKSSICLEWQHNIAPETNIFAPENRPSQNKYSNHPFSGATSVSGRLHISPSINFPLVSTPLGWRNLKGEGGRSQKMHSQTQSAWLRKGQSLSRFLFFSGSPPKKNNLSRWNESHTTQTENCKDVFWLGFPCGLQVSWNHKKLSWVPS